MLTKKSLFCLFFYTLLVVPAYGAVVTFPGVQDVYCVTQQVVLIGLGVPGVGKTTFFRELSRRIVNTVFFDKDLLCEALLHGEKYGSEWYDKYAGPDSYVLMVKQAVSNLEDSAARLVILDGQFRSRINAPLLEPLRNFDKVKVKYVYFYADKETIRERLVKRADRRDEPKFLDFDAWCDKEIMLHEEAVKKIPEGDLLKIDTRFGYQWQAIFDCLM